LDSVTDLSSGSEARTCTCTAFHFPEASPDPNEAQGRCSLTKLLSGGVGFVPPPRQRGPTSLIVLTVPPGRASEWCANDDREQEDEHGGTYSTVVIKRRTMLR
jgi:hypothetical protein